MQKSADIAQGSQPRRLVPRTAARPTKPHALRYVASFRTRSCGAHLNAFGHPWGCRPRPIRVYVPDDRKHILRTRVTLQTTRPTPDPFRRFRTHPTVGDPPCQYGLKLTYRTGPENLAPQGLSEQVLSPARITAHRGHPQHQRFVHHCSPAIVSAW